MNGDSRFRKVRFIQGGAGSQRIRGLPGAGSSLLHHLLSQRQGPEFPMETGVRGSQRTPGPATGIICPEGVWATDVPPSLCEAVRLREGLARALMVCLPVQTREGEEAGGEQGWQGLRVFSISARIQGLAL